MSEKPEQIVFHYEKSNLFRVIHVDGAHGGLAVRPGLIVLSVFSERRPIPREEAYTIADDGNLVRDDSKTKSKDGVFREVEASLVLSVRTAAALRDWLNDKINEHQSLVKAVIDENARQHPSA